MKINHVANTLYLSDIQEHNLMVNGGGGGT